MMASLSGIVLLTTVIFFLAKYFALDALVFSPLREVPGPKLYALTKWRLAYDDWTGARTRTILMLHQKYGAVVRIGPNEVSFNTLSALRSIYGPGSRYGRTKFYRMFDVYNRQNLFTYHSLEEHGERKKLISHSYSKSVIMKEPVMEIVENKARKYISLIEKEPGHVSEIFTTLHYYSLDNITEFIYGEYGSTAAMEGSKTDRALIADILDPARRKLSWFMVHFSTLTKWAYAQSNNLTEHLVKPFLPMQKPATYTGIRKYALDTYQKFEKEKTCPEKGQSAIESSSSSILERLWAHHESQKANGMDGLGVASEAADHFLAGIDTTSDTLMFLIWSLSQPRNLMYQEKLREEVLAIPPGSLNKYGYPRADASDRCTYLNAVIKETLRLYAPLPSSEPRSLSTDSEIDGYKIPGNTTVGMSPFTLHRNPDIFKSPSDFNPDRWLGPNANEMNRWFWAFSSGGRTCIGIHLAMAEMTTLVATIYRLYKTTLAPGFENVTPGITARFEVFYDERYANIQEHTCHISFEDLASTNVGN